MPYPAVKRYRVASRVTLFPMQGSFSRGQELWMLASHQEGEFLLNQLLSSPFPKDSAVIGFFVF